MKTINVSFEDREYAELEKIKKRKAMNWHDFIMRIVRRAEINGTA